MIIDFSWYENGSLQFDFKHVEQVDGIVCEMPFVKPIEHDYPSLHLRSQLVQISDILVDGVGGHFVFEELVLLNDGIGLYCD